MIKSATFKSKYSVQSKTLYKLAPLTEKLTVETDYLPYINLNSIICAVCYFYAKQMTKSATLGTINHFCSE